MEIQLLLQVEEQEETLKLMMVKEIMQEMVVEMLDKMVV